MEIATVTENLKAETINALSWSFLESVVTKVVQFSVGIVLARLLLPEQFGLIGMLLIFISIAQVFVQSGFDAALVQKTNATAADICSIFYFNIFVSLFAVGVLCTTAPWIAVFFNQPVLAPLMQVLSLVIVIDSLGAIQGTLFGKEINFRAVTIASLVSGLLSGIVGIILAVEGFGVWSLVAQQVSLSILRTITLWVLSPWRPQLIFSLRSLREMFGFGSWMLFSGILNQVFENIYFPVIGKLFSAADLGLFTRARSIQSLPSQTLSTVIGRVTFPVFSRSQGDPARLKRRLKKALPSLVLLNFPVMVGLAATARPLVIVLMGQEWAGCIPYLQLLCAVGLLLPIDVMNLNILMAMGRSNLFMRLEVIKKLLILINITIAWRWGIFGIIYGMIALSIISFYLNSYYNKYLIDYSSLEQMRDLFPYLGVATLMGIVVYSVGLIRFPSLLGLLLTQILTGASVYIALCWLFRLTAFVELLEELCHRITLLRTDATP